MMGPGVTILTRGHEIGNTDETMICQGAGPERPVTIEDDVWIGMSVIILPGVTIGRGSVIGAGTVVTKAVQPFSVVVGNPGRVVRDRRDGRTSV